MTETISDQIIPDQTVMYVWGKNPRHLKELYDYVQAPKEECFEDGQERKEKKEET